MNQESKNKKPWQKIKSQVVHKNPWFCVREDDVIQPGGKNGKYFVVEGIKSAAVIAEDKEECIYIVGQTRYPIENKFSWEVIGGGLKIGQNFLDVAKQELKEEAGLEAEIWEDLGNVHEAIGYATTEFRVYLAKNLKKGEQKLEPTEDIIVEKKKFFEIEKMIANNEVTCGFSIAAFYKYKIFKNKV